MQSTFLTEHFAQLETLAFDKTEIVRLQKAVEVADFFVLQRPRVKVVAGMNPQSIDLTADGWNDASVMALANKELWDDKPLFIPSSKHFAPEARKQGYFSDKRIADFKMGAILSQSYSKPNKMGKSRPKECEADCLFRHIRNSLAHGNVYRLFHSKILLLDRGNKQEITAYLITSPVRLFRFLQALKSKGPAA